MFDFFCYGIQLYALLSPYVCFVTVLYLVNFLHCGFVGRV